MHQSDPVTLDFLSALRAATAQSHEDLEAHPLSKLIVDPAVSREGYVQYLRVMQRVVAQMEARLYPALAHLLPDIEERRKLPWITADLDALGGLPNPMPEARIVSGDASACELLGALYVLEGSALGGRVILKSLPPEITTAGARYFEGYGKDTGPMWKSFLAVLTQQGEAAPGDAAAIISGAEAAFLGIHAYFNQCADADSAAHA